MGLHSYTVARLRFCSHDQPDKHSFIICIWRQTIVHCQNNELEKQLKIFIYGRELS